ncbi:hypothetical protein [Mesorhizobium silamurunense]|uniref:hypothetical protein n=1 Tax=Mesorhizobium silamurunense TaxID=499528 RepID=UPI001781AD30|nr:hypothetical protein [Mesorhizobium silamurunense]
MVDDHDHAIELAVEVIVLAVAGAEDFTRVIDAVRTVNAAFRPEAVATRWKPGQGIR